MQQFSRPLAPDEAVFCFLSEPNTPEGSEYEKNYQYYIDSRGEVSATLHRKMFFYETTESVDEIMTIWSSHTVKMAAIHIKLGTKTSKNFSFMEPKGRLTRILVCFARDVSPTTFVQMMIVR